MSKMDRNSYYYPKWFATRRGRVLNYEDIIEDYNPEGCQKCGCILDALNTSRYQILDYCDRCFYKMKSTPHISGSEI